MAGYPRYPRYSAQAVPDAHRPGASIASLTGARLATLEWGTASERGYERQELLAGTFPYG